MLFKQQISTSPFPKWFREDRESRRLFKFSAIVIIIQFLIFKFLYPFPNFMPPDSNSYLEAAFHNQMINTWAIGYSKFLRLVSSFTNSHFSLVLIQYLLLQSTLLYFLFSIRYMLAPGKWLFRLLVACSILNPLLLHVSNFVSSDALFAALSLVWFTQLLWILYQPNKRLLTLHALVLLFAFMVRFNALYYPLITISIIAITNLLTRVKLAFICLVILLIGIFIGRTQYQYYTDTGTIQYSAFGGWQIASNALYGYAYASQDAPETVPARFRQLHIIVNRHMDSLRKLILRPDHEVAVYYLWDFKSPLRVYMDFRWRNDSTTPYFKRWATMAPLYSAYGIYLIKHHPWPFIKYYLWPNLIKFYAPPTKFLGSYNLEGNTVEPITVTWFGWKNNKVSTFFKDKKIQITEIFPVLFAIINLTFLLSFIAFLCLGSFSRCGVKSTRILWWTMVIWLTNMSFSVLAAPIELRYQLFTMVITFTFLTQLLSFIIKEAPFVENKQKDYQRNEGRKTFTN